MSDKIINENFNLKRNYELGTVTVQLKVLYFPLKWEVDA